MKAALGRYCLKVCYCGQCPHYRPYVLSRRQIATLLAYLDRPPRYENGKPSPSWYRDPLGGFS